jgi:hypothetical protein
MNVKLQLKNLIFIFCMKILLNWTVFFFHYFHYFNCDEWWNVDTENWQKVENVEWKFKMYCELKNLFMKISTFWLNNCKICLWIFVNEKFIYWEKMQIIKNCHQFCIMNHVNWNPLLSFESDVSTLLVFNIEKQEKFVWKLLEKF